MRVSDAAHHGADPNARLARLRGALPDLKGVALATRSGLLLAADVAEGTDAHGLAALGADLLASGESVARSLAGSEPREATVRGARAHVIVLAAGEGAALVATTDALTPAASVLPDLREAARELAEALAG